MCMRVIFFFPSSGTYGFTLSYNCPIAHKMCITSLYREKSAGTKLLEWMNKQIIVKATHISLQIAAGKCAVLLQLKYLYSDLNCSCRCSFRLDPVCHGWEVLWVWVPGKTGGGSGTGEFHPAAVRAWLHGHKMFLPAGKSGYLGKTHS